jgi:hypothetical protein
MEAIGAFTAGILFGIFAFAIGFYLGWGLRGRVRKRRVTLVPKDGVVRYPELQGGSYPQRYHRTDGVHDKSTKPFLD